MENLIKIAKTTLSVLDYVVNIVHENDAFFDSLSVWELSQSHLLKVVDSYQNTEACTKAEWGVIHHVHDIIKRYVDFANIPPLAKLEWAEERPQVELVAIYYAQTVAGLLKEWYTVSSDCALMATVFYAVLKTSNFSIDEACSMVWLPSNIDIVKEVNELISDEYYCLSMLLSDNYCLWAGKFGVNIDLPSIFAVSYDSVFEEYVGFCLDFSGSSITYSGWLVGKEEEVEFDDEL